MWLVKQYQVIDFSSSGPDIVILFPEDQKSQSPDFPEIFKIALGANPNLGKEGFTIFTSTQN